MDDSQLFEHRQGSAGTATVAVDADVTGTEIDPKLYGKFVEHLYSERNLTNALDAQLLTNPTLAGWKFQVHSPGPDGGRPAEHDPDVIDDRIETYVDHLDLPDADRLRQAYRSGTALFWFPCGDADAVATSPDVGTAEDRAQRIEVEDPDGRAGLATWCYLPLHRTRGFEVTATVRGAVPTTLSAGIAVVDDDGSIGPSLDEATIDAGTEFRTVEAALELPADVDDDPHARYAVTVTVEESANVVLDRLLLYPDDHLDRANPEVVELLAEADLPLLRWPGGNFVSDYHWRDGVGPIEERSTRPNPAWDGIEPHTFGTDEFLALCERVGCKPMLCLNAGSGTPEAAADWVEYCNGDPETTELGALRADHGRAEPYDVTYWEVGNEVYGEWQATWTTPDGYADRFRRFHDAITAVDDSIEVLACGNRLTDWNEPLLSTAGEDLDWITDHVLVGGPVEAGTDIDELCNAYAGFARQLGEEYADLRERMEAAGLDDPRIAITELQLFAFPGDDDGDADDDDEADDDGQPPSRADLPTSDSNAEVVYDATVIHECIRRGEFVQAVTHSGVGNHGGGLRSHKARVWADPCFHHHALGADLFGGTPLGVEVTSDTYSTDIRVGTDTGPLFGEIDPLDDVPVLDVMAVRGADGDELRIVLVHRDATADSIDVTVDPGVPVGGDEATVTRLEADDLTVRNTVDEPAAVAPEEPTVPIDDGTIRLVASPFSLVHVSVPLE